MTPVSRMSNFFRRAPADGNPTDFLFLVDYLHQRGIGVILEQAPANFPNEGQSFGFKWNTDWMHDTLDYMSQDPASAAYHHDKLTFSLAYTPSRKISFCPSRTTKSSTAKVP